MLDDGGVYRTQPRRPFGPKYQIWVLGILFINVQKLLGHDSPGFPYFNTGSRFEVVVNSLDIVVLPVASSPTMGWSGFEVSWVAPGEVAGLIRLLDTAVATHPPTTAPAVKIAARIRTEPGIELAETPQGIIVVADKERKFPSHKKVRQQMIYVQEILKI